MSSNYTFNPKDANNTLPDYQTWLLIRSGAIIPFQMTISYYIFIVYF